MAKVSAFKDFFSEPQNFGGRYVVDAEGLWSEDSIVDKFFSYFADWNWIKPKYLKHQIRKSHSIGWVKWHAGINDDGEPQNMWWLYDKFPVGKKGYKAVYVFNWDKHYIEHGHRYQPEVQDDGRAPSVYEHSCETCRSWINIMSKSEELGKQDLNRLRNAIHNEAGVTKQEIREMVEQAVTHLVEKRVKQLLPDKLSMDTLVDKAIADRSLYWYSKERGFDDRVIQEVGKVLAKKIKIKVEVK